MAAWLETSSGIRIPLHAVCTLGRSSKNTVVLADSLVSRRHALIHAQESGEHWIVDLGSSNGTLLNGARIKQPSRLQNKDRLQILGNVFTYREQAIDDTADQTSFVREKELKSAPHWLVVADIENSTHLSQTLSTDELSQLVGGWFSICKEAVEQNHGAINKYLGDGFLAYWPDPDSSPAAVANLLRVLDRVRERQAPVFRLAVHYGTVTIDCSMADGEVSLLGPEVTFAFRMEKLAASLKQSVLASEPAATHLQAVGVRTEAVGQVAIANFDGRHTFFRCGFDLKP